MSTHPDINSLQTAPDIVAAFSRLSTEEQEEVKAALDDKTSSIFAAAIANLPEPQRTGVIEAINAHTPVENEGARAVVLARLGDEKQKRDSQAWTADGLSPNSALVTKSAAAEFTEAEQPEAVIDDLTAETAEKAEGDLLAAAGHDTGKTLSSDEAAGDEDDGEKKLRGKLPFEFPGQVALDEAGHGTYAKARALAAKGDKWWTDIPGIGDATAAKIEEALKE